MKKILVILFMFSCGFSWSAHSYKPKTFKTVRIVGDTTTHTVTLGNDDGGLIVNKGDSNVTATVDLQVTDQTLTDLELATLSGGIQKIDFSTPDGTSTTLQMNTSISSPTAGFEIINRHALKSWTLKFFDTRLKIGNVSVPNTTGTLNQALRLGSDLETLEWFTPGAASGDVTAAANIADNRIVRGDGGAKGVQQSGVTIDDSDNVTGFLTATIDRAVTFNNDGHISGDLIWKDELGATAVHFDADGNVDVTAPFTAGETDIAQSSDIELVNIKGHTTQTNDILKIQQNGGTAIFRVTNTGVTVPIGDSLVVDGEIGAEDSGGIGLVDDIDNVGVWVEDGGNVGINTKTPDISTPSDKVLTIDGGSTDGDRSSVELAGGATTSNIVGDLTFTNNSSGDADKRLGIIAVRRGTANDTGEMEFYVNSGTSFILAAEIQEDGGTFFPAVNTGSGNAAHFNATTKELLENTSSRKHKKDIIDLPDNETRNTMLLRGRKYKRKSNDSVEIGLLAEEVHDLGMVSIVNYKWIPTTTTIVTPTIKPIIDDLVNAPADIIEFYRNKMEEEIGGTDGTDINPLNYKIVGWVQEPYGVNYQALSVLLLKEVQELNREVDTIKSAAVNAKSFKDFQNALSKNTRKANN